MARFKDEDLVRSVLLYVEEQERLGNPAGFDPTLALDLDDKLEKYPSLLPGQRNALWSQIKGFQIPIVEEEQYMKDVD